jgi:hypothetical protein
MKATSKLNLTLIFPYIDIKKHQCCINKSPTISMPVANLFNIGRKTKEEGRREYP